MGIPVNVPPINHNYICQLYFHISRYLNVGHTKTILQYSNCHISMFLAKIQNNFYIHTHAHTHCLPSATNVGSHHHCRRHQRFIKIHKIYYGIELLLSFCHCSAMFCLAFLVTCSIELNCLSFFGFFLYDFVAFYFILDIFFWHWGVWFSISCCVCELNSFQLSSYTFMQWILFSYLMLQSDYYCVASLCARHRKFIPCHIIVWEKTKRIPYPLKL